MTQISAFGVEELSTPEMTVVGGGELWAISRAIAVAIGETIDFLTDPQRMASYEQLRGG
jgi:hypothetical protein